MRGCVYIIHALTTSYYKIGITTNGVARRQVGLQVTYPFWDLVLVATHYCDEYRKLEKALHDRYVDQRLRNSEWFELTNDDLTTVLMKTGDLIDGLGLNNDELDVGRLFAGALRGEALRNTLNELYNTYGISWRKIAQMPEFKGIPAGSLCSYAGGWEPKTEKSRRMFGLTVTELIAQVRNAKSGQFLKRRSNDE